MFKKENQIQNSDDDLDNNEYDYENDENIIELITSKENNVENLFQQVERDLNEKNDDIVNKQNLILEQEQEKDNMSQIIQEQKNQLNQLIQVYENLQQEEIQIKNQIQNNFEQIFEQRQKYKVFSEDFNFLTNFKKQYDIFQTECSEFEQKNLNPLQKQLENEQIELQDLQQQIQNIIQQIEQKNKEKDKLFEYSCKLEENIAKLEKQNKIYLNEKYKAEGQLAQDHNTEKLLKKDIGLFNEKIEQIKDKIQEQNQILLKRNLKQFDTEKKISPFKINEQNQRNQDFDSKDINESKNQNNFQEIKKIFRNDFKTYATSPFETEQSDENNSQQQQIFWKNSQSSKRDPNKIIYQVKQNQAQQNRIQNYDSGVKIGAQFGRNIKQKNNFRNNFMSAQVSEKFMGGLNEIHQDESSFENNQSQSQSNQAKINQNINQQQILINIKQFDSENENDVINSLLEDQDEDMEEEEYNQMFNVNFDQLQQQENEYNSDNESQNMSQQQYFQQLQDIQQQEEEEMLKQGLQNNEMQEQIEEIEQFQFQYEKQQQQKQQQKFLQSIDLEQQFGQLQIEDQNMKNEKKHDNFFKKYKKRIFLGGFSILMLGSLFFVLQVKKKTYDDFDEDVNPYLKQQLDNRTPLEVLKFDDNEKKRQQAAKDFVNNIFKKHFGDEADKIEERNNQEMYKLKNEIEINHPIDSPILKVLQKHKKDNLDKKIDIIDRVLQEKKKQMEEKREQLQENNIQDTHYNHFGTQKVEGKQNKQYNKSLGQSQQPQNQFQNSSIPQNNQDDINISEKSVILSSKNTEIDTLQFKTNKALSKNERHDYLISCASRNEELFVVYKQYKSSQELQEKIKTYFTQKESQQETMRKRVKKFDQFVLKRRKNNINPLDADFDEIRREFLEKNEMPQQFVFLLDEINIIIWNEHHFGQHLSMHLYLNYHSFENLQRLELVNTDLKDYSLYYFLDKIFKESQSLNQLDLSKNKIGIRTAQVLEKEIMKVPLQYLKLKEMEMNTKYFCMIALGIARSPTILDVNISQNLLDNRSIKTVETLLRYVKNIVRVDISGNDQISQDQKKNLKKIIMNSNQLKGKELRIQ